MKILDNHVHTSFSSDAKDSMETVIKMAIQKGLKYLTITDHLENHITGEWIDYNDYTPIFNYYKEKYKDDIELLLGIEVGYESDRQENIEKILKNYPFDFVICSTHSIDGEKIHNRSYFDGKSKKEAYNRYFEYIIECTKKFKEFNIYGHLDYIIRYGIYENNEICFEEYKTLIDEILINIINNGSGIEINTSGYRYGLDSTHPNIKFIKRYKELGGTIITLGSDSHKAKDLCADFDKAYEILSSCGFEHVCIFKSRKPKFIKI